MTLLLLAAVLAGSALQPVAYSWSIPNPLVSQVDTCSLTFRATAPTTADVALYFWRPQYWGWIGDDGPILWPAGVPLTVARRVPKNAACPCIVCAVQLCPQGWTWAQCGAVLRPGDVLPDGWTRFEEMGLVPACWRPRTIFNDGFESGGLGQWKPHPRTEGDA